MLTKTRWVIISIRINWIFIPFIVFPFRAFAEVIEGVYDIVSIFRPFTKLVLPFIDIADGILNEFESYGNLDLVDVMAKAEKHNISVKILLR